MNMQPKANFNPNHARYAWARFSRGELKAVSIHLEHPETPKKYPRRPPERKQTDKKCKLK